MTTSGTTMPVGTRRDRRRAIIAVTRQLSAVREAERLSLDNTPDNFTCTESFEVGEHAVETLDEIMLLISEVY
jgi:hypothetical protein